MIRIGEFSKISQVSIKTLRYYDEVGLLKPVQVDPFTGYRYYTFEQLPQLNRILALKDLGFSLEEIAQFTSQALPPAELRGMLRLKRAELRSQVQEELERLERVETRLRQLEQEEPMATYEVVIKKLEPQWIASVRDVIPSYPEQGHLWDELMRDTRNLQAAISGPCLTIYHADEPEIDAEVCEPVSGPLKASGRVKVYELPGVAAAASTVHHGPFQTLSQAYTALLKWIEANGYRVSGPCREVYLTPAQNGRQDDPQTVTEILFPVEKG
jgi:DNA-binding transcriptional MerR regulator